MQMFSSKAQSFSHFLCHLRITVKCTFWFSRSEVSPGILYFSQSPCNIEVAVPFPPLELKSGVRINIWELWSPIWSWVIGSFPKAMNFVMVAQNCPVIQTLPLSPPPPHILSQCFFWHHSAEAERITYIPNLVFLPVKQDNCLTTFQALMFHDSKQAWIKACTQDSTETLI